MDSVPTIPGFTLLGEPTAGNLYAVLLEKTQDSNAVHDLTIPAAKLSGWLMARGCEFCAHQVKLGRMVRCDHPPLTLADLGELGFVVDGL